MEKANVDAIFNSIFSSGIKKTQNPVIDTKFTCSTVLKRKNTDEQNILENYNRDESTVSKETCNKPFSCYTCEHMFIDEHYKIKAYDNIIETEMPLCSNSTLTRLHVANKKLTYDKRGIYRNIKDLNLIPVDTDEIEPVPIGLVVWTCNGKYYHALEENVDDIF